MSEENVAQPAPQVGQTIPNAVEDTVYTNPDGTPNWQETLAHAFVYREGWQAGDKLEADQGTVADVLNREVLEGRITPEQAIQSAQASGLTTGPGAYEPPAGPA